ncbi:hypothetical protein, partial [Micromonospora sp. NPDC005087]|uniref:hypothetical protein n=1 Tax=Micromonospora sp. NPDC005087 TaxID=3364225 RepID=UPI0036778ADA
DGSTPTSSAVRYGRNARVIRNPLHGLVEITSLVFPVDSLLLLHGRSQVQLRVMRMMCRRSQRALTHADLRRAAHDAPPSNS